MSDSIHERLTTEDGTGGAGNGSGGAKRTIAQTAVLMAILTLVSKCLGFIREMVIAGFFGTSYIVDAYVMAQAIPGILFGGIFVSIGTAYMPTFSGITEKEGKEAGRRFTNEVFNVVLLLAAAASIVGIALSGWLVKIAAPGFTGETAKLTAFYLRIAFLYLLFSGGFSILEAYMQYNGKYLSPVVSSYVQNIAIITVAVISAYTSYYYLAFGLLIGYALRMFCLMFCAGKSGFKYKPKFVLNSPIKKIVALAIPVFIGTYVTQINIYVDRFLASGLPEGSVAALNYGMMIVTLITGLTASVISIIAYPKITRAVSNSDWKFFNDAVGKAVNVVLIISVPFCLGAIAFSEEVIQVVYERGAFNEAATNLTGPAFKFYAVGLVFVALNTLLTNVFYSLRDMKTPVICVGIGVVFNVGFNLLLIGPMAHKGLALATSIAWGVTFVIMAVCLTRKQIKVKVFRDRKKVLKILAASVIAVAAAVAVYALVSGPLGAIIYIRLARLLLAVAAAAAVYFALLKAMRVDEADLIKTLL